MENRNTGSDAGDVSSATAVLLGALAPGVNVRIFTLRSLPILTFSIPFFSLNFCDYFFVIVCFDSGSYMDYFKVHFFIAGSLSCCYAGLSILFQWFTVDFPCCIPCSNLPHPLLASQLVLSFFPIVNCIAFKFNLRFRSSFMLSMQFASLWSLKLIMYQLGPYDLWMWCDILFNYVGF